MDNTLTIQLFFFAAAVPVALEAYKARGMARTALWGAAALFGIAGFIWPLLSKTLPMITGGLAQLATNPVTWFVLSVAVFFVVRPYWAPGAHDGSVITAPPYDDTNIRGELTALTDQRQAIVEDYQNMRGLEARFTGEMDGLKEAIQRRNKSFEDRHFIDEQKLAELRLETQKSVNTLFLALQALRARETEKFYAEIIQEEANNLQQDIGRDQRMTDEGWASWQDHQNKFEGALRRWLELAAGWHPGIKVAIYAVDPKSLTTADWGDIDELFSNSNQLITYKTNLIHFRNWLSLRNHVTTAIHLAAFGGPDSGDILSHIPGGGPTVASAKEANGG
jgi:hypothetical protein